jgi:predicted HicB family RNase H-like nuclease
VVNQHSYPHWPDLEEQLMLRFPGAMYDDIQRRAELAGVSMNEWIRLVLHDVLMEAR